MPKNRSKKGLHYYVKIPIYSNTCNPFFAYSYNIRAISVTLKLL
jgi:hypothetical protein